MSTLNMRGVAARIRSRVVERVQVEGFTACWLWQGAATRDGYGKIKVCGQTVGTHRAAYEAFKGDIPPGQVIDHRCRQRLCCNPDHLRAMTQARNVRHAIRGATERRVAAKAKADRARSAWSLFPGEEPSE